MLLLSSLFASRASARTLDLTHGLRTDRKTFFSVRRTHHRISVPPTLACTSPGLSRHIHVSYSCHSTSQCQAPQFLWATTHIHPRKVGLCLSRSIQSKVSRQALSLWSIAYGYSLSLPRLFVMRSNTDYLLQNHQLPPVCRRAPFRADCMKEVIRQTDRGEGPLPQR